MLDLFQKIEQIAKHQTSVLLLGESGTGKELVAKAIHKISPRAEKPFIAINCGAIPENLIESELFGHTKGAFTDAIQEKKGLFLEADGGTLFLDEIGELPPQLQVKLLRVLQERTITPIGDSKEIPIDVRIVSATLRDLDTDIDNGRFRSDLFYRLSVASFHLPPLRERTEDIPLLIEYFMQKIRAKYNLSVTEISKEAHELLCEYLWPGNIRELENAIERAMILADHHSIKTSNLPPNIQRKKVEATQTSVSLDNLSIKEQSKNLEIALITKALEQTKGNRTHAAKILEISHRALLYKIKEYQLEDL